MVHRMKEDWRAVREAFKKEQDSADAYADRRRVDYQFLEGQDVLINRRRHYRGQVGSGRGSLALRAVGHFRIKRVLTPCTMELEIHIAIRGRAVPVFNSSDLIPYESRVLDLSRMLPEEVVEERSECGNDNGDYGGGQGR